ncbi:dCTP deaminase [Methylocystis parvus OBBP]|uniref:dCTP deaminase n=1 Tax=Methylocystis parvus TaxID=134 RepID=UPI001FCC39BF|nr:dCTP deaminase [Methylocystis parvus]WBK00326.1 dCTP deaminase [Methylocystis parvus OBBP]
MSLSDNFSEWSSLGSSSPIHPGSKEYSYTKIASTLQAGRKGPYTLKPQSFVLAWTAEKVEIPITSRLAARVEGKSSLARLGVGIHVTAPVIHSGFKGNIQLEMFNFGPHHIVLEPGMWVCQLVFELTTGTPEKGYQGIFAGQTA